LKSVFIIAVVAVAAMIGVMVPSVFAETSVDCNNLIPNALLMGCDLHDLTLTNTDLSGANLSGANFFCKCSGGAALTNTDLSGANLSGADLSRADIRGVDLSGANLSGADLSRASLSGVIFHDTQFSDTNLSWAVISEDVNLSGIDFRNSNLTGTIFIRADLSGANLAGIKFTDGEIADSNFSGADLSNADLTGTQISTTDLSGANLSGAILGDPDWQGMGMRKLLDVDLSGANLSGADLRNMRLSNANLSGADLTGTRLSDYDAAHVVTAYVATAKESIPTTITNPSNSDPCTWNGSNAASRYECQKSNAYSNIGKNPLPSAYVALLENEEYVTEHVGSKKSNEIKDSTKCGTGTIENTEGQCIVEQKNNSSKGGGCLIATATYGSEMATEVQQLRELRDNQLLQTESGTAFMGMFNDIYYSFSPTIADMEREHPMFKEAVKIAITPMISSLSLMENAESESEVLGIGISVIMLNLGMYLGIPAIVVIGIKRKF